MTNTVTKARLIQSVDGVMIRTDFEIEHLIDAMEFRGFKFVGLTGANPRHRAQLHNQPKFKGVLGPMWDGDALRYEDQASYDALSI